MGTPARFAIGFCSHIVVLAPAVLWRGHLDDVAACLLVAAGLFAGAEAAGQVGTPHLRAQDRWATAHAVWLGAGWFVVVGAGSAGGVALGAGLLLIGAGTGLRAWAIRTLGRGFANEPRAGQPLVTHGPYRWLRHPSEAGTLVVGLGLVVWVGAGMLGWWVPLAALTVARVRREEAALRDLYGQAHEAYARRVGWGILRA